MKQRGLLSWMLLLVLANTSTTVAQYTYDEVAKKLSEYTSNRAIIIEVAAQSRPNVDEIVRLLDVFEKEQLAQAREQAVHNYALLMNRTSQLKKLLSELVPQPPIEVQPEEPGEEGVEKLPQIPGGPNLRVEEKDKEQNVQELMKRIEVRISSNPPLLALFRQKSERIQKDFFAMDSENREAIANSFMEAVSKVTSQNVGSIATLNNQFYDLVGEKSLALKEVLRDFTSAFFKQQQLERQQKQKAELRTAQAQRKEEKVIMEEIDRWFAQTKMTEQVQGIMRSLIEACRGLTLETMGELNARKDIIAQELSKPGVDLNAISAQMSVIATLHEPGNPEEKSKGLKDALAAIKKLNNPDTLMPVFARMVEQIINDAEHNNFQARQMLGNLRAINKNFGNLFEDGALRREVIRELMSILEDDRKVLESKTRGLLHAVDSVSIPLKSKEDALQSWQADTRYIAQLMPTLTRVIQEYAAEQIKITRDREARQRGR